ncbi:hypothetical protein EXT73_11715 [Pectobacterium atrosepticum]|uniref:HEPN domain-containing protein n=1 Tax=Pectobacterium odoriferum TaxID=78398 RepID=UPI000507709E|nr:HEPN domain-containing protein [Pectobacterium odoriferum]KGA28382.1 hypothetical protein KS43_21700 [Pectobacterium odoriferum]MCL6391135.1 hypothetical protein [Pectobacterium atrosepticum]
MKIHEYLDLAIKELITPSAITFNFATSKNGCQYNTTNLFEQHIKSICNALMENDNNLKNMLRINQLCLYVKQIVIDCVGENIFKCDESKDSNVRAKLKILKEKLNDILNKKIITTDLTMYYTSDAIPLPDDFKIGPVKFINPLVWVDTIRPREDFNILGEEISFNWRENFKKNYLHRRKFDFHKVDEFDQTSETLREFLGRDNIVLKITLSNFEPNRAWEHGRMICKTALDGLSFIVNDSRLFFRQVLQGSSKPLYATYQLFEFDSYLISPGMTLPEIISPYSSEISFKILKERSELVQCVSKIVSGISTSESSMQPYLSMRCSTALEWFSESIREKNDYIAISKLCISLDVLCDGGKSDGISKLCSLLLDISENDNIPFFKETNIKTFVRDSYEKGRSHIIHGNRVDRSEDYKDERAKIQKFCHMILSAYFKKFSQYNGDDDYHTFYNYIKDKKN